MSARDQILEKDRKLTRFDWFRKTKQTLRLRCADNGLQTDGKKAVLIDRLFNFLHPTSNPMEGPSGIGDTSSSEDEEETTTQHHATPRKNDQVPSIPLDEIRTIIQEELSRQQTSQQPLLATQVPLSPASICRTAFPTTTLGAIPASQTAMPLQQLSGLSNSFSTQIPPMRNASLLPPMAEKMMNDIKNKNFIDFNSLLPNALYDPSTYADNLCLEFHPSTDGLSSFSLQPKQSRKRKINNAASWFEAWNIYLRAMAFFHPGLIPDLLAYQDFICTLQRTYPVTAWLRYDIAFRLHAAMDKSLPWSSIDDQAFNKFVRCPAPPSTISCFNCGSESHLANACPQRSFRTKREPGTPHTFPSNNQPINNSCRFFNSSKCENRACRFPHKCSSCSGNHPAFKCRTTQQLF